jgi:hypothetical protein
MNPKLLEESFIVFFSENIPSVFLTGDNYEEKKSLVMMSVLRIKPEISRTSNRTDNLCRHYFKMRYYNSFPYPRSVNLQCVRNSIYIVYILTKVSEI